MNSFKYILLNKTFNIFNKHVNKTFKYIFK